MLIYFTMDWLRELSNLVITHNHDSLTKLSVGFKRAPTILLFFGFSAVILDLVYFGAVIIYWDTVHTHNLMNKGIFFLLFIYVVNLIQVGIDITAIVNIYRSWSILDTCLKSKQ